MRWKLVPDRLSWRGASIGLLCAAVCVLISQSLPIRLLEERAFDRGFVYRGARETSSRIVIVDLDERTLRQIGKPMMFLSPELASVVTFIHQQGASAIGIDMMVRGDPGKIMQLRPGRAGALEAMGQAVGQVGNVVLPQWMTADAEPLLPPFEWYVPSDRPWADLGVVDQRLDADSCSRRLLLRWVDESQNVHPSFALALLIKAGMIAEESLQDPSVLIHGRPIPEDAEGCLRVNFLGSPGTVTTVSFFDVLQAAQGEPASALPVDWEALMRDGIVLVGATAPTMKDQFSTPYTQRTLWQQWFWPRPAGEPLQMSGVELHANAIATLADRAFITTPWFLQGWVVLPVTGAILGCLLVRCTLETGMLLTLAHHLLWRYFALLAFCWANLRVETVAVYSLGVLLYGSVFMLRWRWIRRMMGLVKSEAVARVLEARGAKLEQLGERRKITVFFSDIRNFTTFSEQHRAEEVVRLLNAFFAEIVPVIESEGGTVNTYIGDAVFVIFGAPEPQHDHALRAVRAAISVIERVRGKSELWQSLGASDFQIGVGVHTGEAVVGTIGSPRRLDYTAIGDTVNTASRLESANKQLGTQGLISQSTFDALPESVRQQIAEFGPAQSLQVKGKSEPLIVYAIGGRDRPA